MTPNVFVSGCFDLLHSGHVEFFNSAAKYGDLSVAIGSDQTIYDLKGRPPVNSEDERLFIIQNIACVKNAFISSGTGYLDFEPDLRERRPDIFVVNEDGNAPDKRTLCEELGIQYVVLHRDPHEGLSPRSTTSLREIYNMPYRIDLAGGWLDQPFVSKHHPGPVITISLEPTVEFNDRSGMATSTRRKAIDLWGPRLPAGDPVKLARVLFAYDNPPGTQEVSGSQDSIGICIPGLNQAWYEGEYWPKRIDHVNDEEKLRFIEQSLYLIPLGPRHMGYSVLSDTRIDAAGAKALSDAASSCWQAILATDIAAFGRSLRASLDAQVAMFPHMMNETIRHQIKEYENSILGWKISGAGGGGYLILVSDRPVAGALKVHIRRGTG